MKNLKNILYQENKSIDVKNKLYSTRNLNKNFPQTYGGSKFVCPFWIRPTDNFRSHQGEVSGPMNADTINVNRKSKNQQC